MESGGFHAWEARVYSLMEELDKASLKQPSLLPCLLDELLSLTGGRSPAMPLAYRLLVRLLYLEADAGPRVTRSLLANLRSHKDDVVVAALGASSDLYPYAGALRPEVLAAIFDAGERALPFLRQILTAEAL